MQASEYKLNEKKSIVIDLKVSEEENQQMEARKYKVSGNETFFVYASIIPDC